MNPLSSSNRSGLWLLKELFDLRGVHAMVVKTYRINLWLRWQSVMDLCNLSLRGYENIPVQTLCILTFLSHGAHSEATLFVKSRQGATERVRGWFRKTGSVEFNRNLNLFKHSFFGNQFSHSCSRRNGLNLVQRFDQRCVTSPQKSEEIKWHDSKHAFPLIVKPQRLSLDIHSSVDMFRILGGFYLPANITPHFAGAAYGVIGIWRFQRRI